MKPQYIPLHAMKSSYSFENARFFFYKYKPIIKFEQRKIVWPLSFQKQERVSNMLKIQTLKPLDLIGLHERVSLGNGLPPGGLVIIRAVVFVRVPVEGAEHVTAAAPESGETHALSARKAAVRLAWWRGVLLLLGFGLISGRAARRTRPVDSQVFGSNLLGADVRSWDRNLTLNLLRLVKGRFGGVKQNKFTVTLGAETHGGRASEETTVVGTAYESFRDLAPGLLFLPVPALLGHVSGALEFESEETKIATKTKQQNKTDFAKTRLDLLAYSTRNSQTRPDGPKRPWKD